MARYDFGGTLADFVVTSRRLGGLDVLGLSAATLTFWSAQTGGTRYTDLQLNGSTVSSIAVGTDGQVPKFQGPDGVTEMWADGGSPRVRVVTLQGAPGPVGPQGAASTVPGPTGPTGPQGPQGIPGVNGVANDTATAGQISTPGTATDTALKAAYTQLTSVATTATASATLAANRHTPVDATSAARTMTLPTAAAGTLISVEKTDASTNAVNVTGTLRGVASSTIALTSQYDARTFLSEGGGSWRPVSDHRTKTTLDTAYGSRTGAKNVGQGEHVLNVKDYGAKGDGTNDDTAAITAAIAASNTATESSGAGKGREVFFPAGRYKVTSTITLPTGTTLQGASGGFFTTNDGESRIFMSGSTASVLASAAGADNIRIRHLKLIGSGSATVDIIGAAGDTCQRVLIEGCYITNTAGVGVRMADTQTSIIRDCYISGCTSHAIHLKSCYDNLVTGCQIDTYQSGTDSFGGNGVTLDNTGVAAAFSDYNVVTGCFIFLCDKGVQFVNARGNLVTGNRINTCNYGVMLQSFGGATNIERNLVTGNTFYDHGYKSGGVGVIIDGTPQYNTVAGNHFSRETGSGFNFAVQVSTTASNNFVTGNIARNLVQSTSYRNASTGAGNVFTNNVVAGNALLATSTLASAGAVALDAVRGDAFQVTLNANATSSTLANGYAGQRLTITWVQDATGGRTYVWPTVCKFAGGAAPSDTTASRRTSVTFLFDGTNWNETARAVAVG